MYDCRMTTENPNEPDILEQQATKMRVVLWRANKAVEQVEIAHLRQQGLCMSDFAILEVLLHKGPLPVNLIGNKVLLTSGSITTAVVRLESRGWVCKTVDRNDRRVFRVSLTPKGRQFIKKRYAAHVACLREVAEGLRADERQMFIELTKKLGHHAEGLMK